MPSKLDPSQSLWKKELSEYGSTEGFTISVWRQFCTFNTKLKTQKRALKKFSKTILRIALSLEYQFVGTPRVFVACGAFGFLPRALISATMALCCFVSMLYRHVYICMHIFIKFGEVNIYVSSKLRLLEY